MVSSRKQKNEVSASDLLPGDARCVTPCRQPKKYINAEGGERGGGALVDIESCSLQHQHTPTMKFSVIQFLKSQFTTLPEVDSFVPDLSGRTVIVTGSNVSVKESSFHDPTHIVTKQSLFLHLDSGLGFECAKALSRHNPARLILAVRNVAAGESAARDIVSANPPGVKTIPEVWKLDLGDLASVKAFGERAEKELDRLDIVVRPGSCSSSCCMTNGLTEFVWVFS
jgi:hypothetical protein